MGKPNVIVNGTVCELLLPAGMMDTEGCKALKMEELELTTAGSLRVMFPLPTLSM